MTDEKTKKKALGRYAELMRYMARKDAVAKLSDEFSIERTELFDWCVRPAVLAVAPWDRIYKSIVGRCKHHRRYAGRGIKCLITADEIRSIWERDGAAKMRRPSIDRIDPDGHYELSNCRIIENSENAGRARHPKYSQRKPGPHYNTEIAKWLREFAEKAGGQLKAATALGVALNTYNTWVRGHIYPKKAHGMLRRLAEEHLKKLAAQI